MNRRNIILGAPSALALSGCFYGRRFDISWSEEILLRDGRILIAHITRSMERIDNSIFKYGGRIFERDTKIAIDLPIIGRIEQFFEGYHPTMIDFHSGAWWGLLNGSPYYGSQSKENQDWNDKESFDGNTPIILHEKRWRPSSFKQFPKDFNTYNLVTTIFANTKEMARMDGKFITINDKINGIYKFGGEELRVWELNIRRPQVQ